MAAMAKYIPHKIHLLQFGEPHVLKEYQEYYDGIIKLHKEWQITIHKLSNARSLIAYHFPQYLGTFDGYSLDIQRADFSRIVLMYLFGGFYLDLDILCFKSLDDLCRHSVILGEEKILTSEECNKLQLEHSVRIANYMFGSVPKHPFWLNILSTFHKVSRQPVLTEEDVLNTTGPGLLTSVYHNTKSQFRDVILLANKKHRCLKSCNRISCHFGDYAAHLHLGKWRWGAADKNGAS